MFSLRLLQCAVATACGLMLLTVTPAAPAHKGCKGQVSVDFAGCFVLTVKANMDARNRWAAQCKQVPGNKASDCHWQHAIGKQLITDIGSPCTGVKKRRAKAVATACRWP